MPPLPRLDNEFAQKCAELSVAVLARAGGELEEEEMWRQIEHEMIAANGDHLKAIANVKRSMA